MYDSDQTIERLAGARNQDDFLEDGGEIYPAYESIRPFHAAWLRGNPEFLTRLTEHFQWINRVFTRGAACRLAHLRDAYVVGSVINQIRGDEVVTIYETARPIDRPYSGHLEWTPERLRENAVTITCGAPALYLGSMGSFDYGHWLVDDLSRVQAARAVMARTGTTEIEFYIPGFTSELNQRKLESLLVMGYGSANSITCFVPSEQTIHFESLWFATPVSYHPALKSPSACQYLRDRARAHPLRASGPLPSSWIYLTHRLCHGRTIFNQIEVTALFRRRGFSIIDVDSMTFGELVSVFRDAEIVAGCMGAAMTNSIFCAPGTKVLHLAAEGWMEPFYWDLAATCGHRYAAFFGPSADPAREPHAAPFHLNVTALAGFLDEILAA